jgi:putative transposase
MGPAVFSYANIPTMRYRRALVSGATYFFTVNLANWKSTLLINYIKQLRDSVRRIRAAHPFEIVAWVVLPDHLHMVWALPESDLNFPMR